jgi:hypothetical protein
MVRDFLSFVRLVVFPIAIMLGIGFQAFADETARDIATTNQPAMSVSVHAKIEGSFMPYRYAFITAGAAKFTFLVPDRYRVDSSDPTNVKLISPDCSCFIVVGIRNGESVRSVTSVETLHNYVNEHYLDVQFLGDQTVSVGGQTAPGVDFNWKADQDIIRTTRTSFFPTATGMLEFTLTTSPDKFQTGLNELNLVMLTFRTGINGRFDYVIGSNQP